LGHRQALTRHGEAPSCSSPRLAYCRAALAIALLAASFTSAGSQGYEVLPWPAKKAVPALVATDLDGQVWRLADLRGQGVVINFWASWCEPCRAEMPSLQALTTTYAAQRLVVLTVNFKESPAVAQRFAQRENLRLPVLPDLQGQLARQWGVTVFPSTVLLGADGRVRSVVRGGLDWSSPEAARLLTPLFVLRKPAQIAQR
jgi:thiol-disulfide isomerase/thioredoxin